MMVFLKFNLSQTGKKKKKLCLVSFSMLATQFLDKLNFKIPFFLLKYKKYIVCITQKNEYGLCLTCCFTDEKLGCGWSKWVGQGDRWLVAEMRSEPPRSPGARLLSVWLPHLPKGTHKVSNKLTGANRDTHLIKLLMYVRFQYSKTRVCEIIILASV